MTNYLTERPWWAGGIRLKKMNKRTAIIIAALITVAGIAIIAALFIQGIIKINTPSRAQYPVRGVDVSSYQGIIDWEVLASQDLQFAFIKATEGSSHVDKYFDSNYREALKTGMRVGAYHFFSYDSAGETQADNFITTVPKVANMLPPVVDVEFYGDKLRNLPDKGDVTVNLTALLEKLTGHYGLKPIIYSTPKSYRLYIAGGYPDYGIWIRDVFFRPALPDKRSWTFWQFSDKGLLDGYQGREKYIDLNVFYGSQQEFDAYLE